MRSNDVEFTKITEIAHHVLVTFGKNGLRHLMHEIPVSKARSWKEQGNYWVPQSIKTICPVCNEPSSLTLKLMHTGNQLNQVTQGLEGECTQCPGKAKVWIINPSDKKSATRACESIWMLPIPTGKRKAIVFPEGKVPKRILKAYLLAIQCFNSRIWSSAINECGRVIEGVTEDKFPSDEDRKALKNILSQLNQTTTVEATLFRSILELSSAIRLSRKSGSHFQYTDDPNSETASKVIELTEHTLEYFYSLPYKAEQTKKLIDELEKSKDCQAEESNLETSD